MRRWLPAFAVHLLTATGAVLAFQALLAAVAHCWEEAFGWLGVALVVDAIDGPLARRIKINERLPQFSGERLDLIVDYLTYVLVPALIIYEAQLLPAYFSPIGIALILLSSLYHFSDRESKTTDGFFVGFPTLWNVVALYLFIFPMVPMLAFALLSVLAALTFIPFTWVHPVRVRRLRFLTGCVVTAWAVSAVGILVSGFPGPLLPRAVIAFSSIYFVGVGVIRSFEGKLHR